MFPGRIVIDGDSIGGAFRRTFLSRCAKSWSEFVRFRAAFDRRYVRRLDGRHVKRPATRWNSPKASFGISRSFGRSTA